MCVCVKKNNNYYYPCTLRWDYSLNTVYAIKLVFAIGLFLFCLFDIAFLRFYYILFVTVALYEVSYFFLVN